MSLPLSARTALAIACCVALAAGCGPHPTHAALSPSAAPVLLLSPSPSPSPSLAPKPKPKPKPAAKPKPKPVTGSLVGRVIVLDPGHNGENWKIPSSHQVYAGNGITKLCNTTGTSTTGGYPEHAFTWDVALRAKKLLEARGAKVILTRSSDDGVGPCFDKRAAIGNNLHADVEVAIHADGGPTGGHGFHVMRPPLGNPAINPGASAQSRALATAMHGAFHASTGIPFSTYITGGYLTTTSTGGINLSTRPDITIECLNMKNAGDAAMATSAAWRQRIAAGIVAGGDAAMATSAAWRQRIAAGIVAGIAAFLAR